MCLGIDDVVGIVTCVFTQNFLVVLVLLDVGIDGLVLICLCCIVVDTVGIGGFVLSCL